MYCVLLYDRIRQEVYILTNSKRKENKIIYAVKADIADVYTDKAHFHLCLDFVYKNVTFQSKILLENKKTVKFTIT